MKQLKKDKKKSLANKHLTTTQVKKIKAGFKAKRRAIKRAEKQSWKDEVKKYL